LTLTKPQLNQFAHQTLSVYWAPPVKEQGTCALIRSAVASPSVERVAGWRLATSPSTSAPRPSLRVGPVFRCSLVCWSHPPQLHPSCAAAGMGGGPACQRPSGVVFFEVAHSRLRYPRFKRWLDDRSGQPSESGHAIKRCAAVGSISSATASWSAACSR